MESNNNYNETKSISLYNLDKKENNLIFQIKKPKLKSSKCSLSRKKTNNLMIKNIFDDNKLKENSKLLNETPITKQSKKSSNLKTNYSISKINNIKNKDLNSFGMEKKIYTINIQLDSKIQKYLKKTNIQKNFYLKGNKKNKTKSIKKKNINGIQKTTEKSKKKLNMAITPHKNTLNRIKSGSKPIEKNLLFLDISNNSDNSKTEFSNNKNKFSKSVIEQPKNTLNNNSNNNHLSKKLYDKIIKDEKININIIRNKTENNNTNENKKILVIDLDETLIHTSFQKIENPDFQIQLDSSINKKNVINKENNNHNNDIPIPKKVNAYIRIRPGVDKFLSQMSKYYDIYVYSASSKNYLNAIIKNIDKNNIIKRMLLQR